MYIFYEAPLVGIAFSLRPSLHLYMSSLLLLRVVFMKIDFCQFQFLLSRSNKVNWNYI